jgi:hypothetical protein
MKMRHVPLCALLVINFAHAAPELVTPSCSDPSPLEGEWHEETPGYLVSMRSSWMPALLRVTVLEWKYDFRAGRIFRSSRIFFISSISPQSLAALRCDLAIRYVEYNMPLQLARGTRSNKTMEPTR